MTEQSITRETTEVSGEDLEHTLDRLSLEQALQDFEIANARVIDLTQRLISANGHVASLQTEIEIINEELEELRLRYNSMQGSAAFRIASKIWAVRNLLRA